MSASRVAISGNTYPVKDQLKSLGATWDPARKVWMISAAQADAARKIVSGSATTSSSGHRTCHDCGCPSKGYYRCYDCSREYADGGSRHRGGMSYRDSRGNFVLGDDD